MAQVGVQLAGWYYTTLCHLVPFQPAFYGVCLLVVVQSRSAASPAWRSTACSEHSAAG
jgi:hypothetical protein